MDDFKRGKNIFENLRFFRFFCLKSVFFYNNIIIIIAKKTVFWTLLGEFSDFLVETLGFDGPMDDFKMGKNIFWNFTFFPFLLPQIRYF